MPTVGLGWLRGTIRGAPEEVLAVVAAHLGEPAHRPIGAKWYAASATFMDRAAMVAWDGRGSAAGTVLVDVPQRALDALGWAGSLALARDLTAAGFRASRVDVYADDRARLADPSDVMAAIRAGDVVTHAQGHEWRENSGGGATAYLGARESERMLRVYRKDPNGEDPRTRWELEIKGAAAAASLLLLIEGAEGRADTASITPTSTGPLGPEAPSRSPAPSSLRNAATVGVGLIVGFADFRARSGNAHGSRAPRLDWWARLVGSLERVKVASAVRIDSLARRVGWVRSQVAPTLAAIWAHPDYGNGWLNRLLTDGLDRNGGRPAWLTAN